MADNRRQTADDDKLVVRDAETGLRRKTFSLAQQDEATLELVGKTEHRTLAVWAMDCVERVMPFFETKYPHDNRPRVALQTLKMWIETGVFKMSVVRKASLDSHAAAREVRANIAARSAARAAGQAVATAHVRTHAPGAAIYALQAVHRAADPSEAAAVVATERAWQYNHLVKLRKTPARRQHSRKQSK